MPRVLIDGQIFSIQKRGGIGRVFASLYQEFEKAKFSQSADTKIFLGVVLSKFRELPMGQDGKFRIRYGWTGKAKIALCFNWLFLWLQPYQILHSTYYFKPFLYRRKGSKHVVTLHDMIPEDFPSEYPDGNPHLSKLAYLRNADRIVCVSRYTMSRLEHHHPQLVEKARVIHSGVNFPEFLDKAFERNSILLYVGKRNGYKDFNTFLNSLPLILENHSQVSIVAVGSDPFSKSEQELISRLGLSEKVIQRQLSDDELQQAYSNCLAVVVTSHVEGFGLPILEAMASGALVVATDIPVFREIAGNAYISFTPGDSEELSQRILSILKNADMFEANRVVGRKIAKEYSWEKTAKELLSLYEELLI